MRKCLLIISIILFPTAISAQIIYEPLHNDVYKYLDKLSQKGIIKLEDNIKPLSRMYIAEKLVEIKLNEKILTTLEKEELDFYIKDFSLELNAFSLDITKKLPDYLNQNQLMEKIKDYKPKEKIIFAGFDQAERWRLFSYSSDLFKINVSPILGYETGKKDGEKNTHMWNGIGFYGYLKDYIGFSFNYRDNSESGENIDINKDFTKETGIITSRRQKHKIEYSEVRTNIAANWSWGDVSVGKDFLEWGYGESGKLVLSQKAPSFPFVRLDIKPVDWLSFNYFHAWLSSDVIDSNGTYATKSTLAGQLNRIIYRDKYLASHTINIFPIQGLTLSLGESVIYSDKLEIAYLMPLMFFRLADHYLMNGSNNAGSNSQFFFGVSSRNHIKNTHLYGTLFIDEITLSGLFDKKKQRNQFGFSLGGTVVDLPINNLSLTAEYTKIYPFVYTHYIATQTYTNASYNLGYWMGNNADLLYGSLNYKLLRGLNTRLWGEYIRKGEPGTVEQQYMQPQPPFLFGLDTRYLYAGVEVKYEFTHDLFLRGLYQYTKTSTEQINGSFTNSSYNELHIAVYYGL